VAPNKSGEEGNKEDTTSNIKTAWQNPSALCDDRPKQGVQIVKDLSVSRELPEKKKGRGKRDRENQTRRGWRGDRHGMGPGKGVKARGGVAQIEGARRRGANTNGVPTKEYCWPGLPSQTTVWGEKKLPTEKQAGPGGGGEERGQSGGKVGKKV